MVFDIYKYNEITEDFKTLLRTLNNLSDKKILSKNNGLYIILDYKKLKSLSADIYR